ncbi:isopeptide-forming domain-containing fimbrial protein [Trueperella bernardiae]|uniref:isopeptide-forming domain-containing fimbrial protein n=1 Tax=Trueperella bernardiae TaxID=59561 RepID=UPI0023F34997|nr:isopeptide-forming domain-containing fimbrial protein [Trueperella bernardiae]
MRLPQVKPNYPNSVIAAGELRVKVPYVRSGNNANDNTNVTLKASTPTYVAADGSESVEDASNNQNRAPIVRGNWTGAWVVASQYPKAYPGIGWSDTSRAAKGATVMSVSGIVPQRTEAAADAWVCNTLDTERVDFVDAHVVADVDAKPNVYYGDPVEELKILYYTGEVKDPNLFECGTVETRRDEGTDEKDGWTYTRPADLSTVKAVKVRVSRENGYLSSLPQSFFYLVVEQRIHDDVQIGDEADYTIRFGLESEIANMPNDTVVIEDTLAPGMTYVEGSAATEPTVSKDAEGRQVLTWTVEDVVPNIDVLKNNPYTINYKATMPKDAKAGAVFTNTVVASSQGNSRRAEVKVTVPRAGYTSIKKHVEKPVVDTLTNGVAANTWTIDLTSKDPEKSTVTDVIDVLPYDGDDKGSKFSGTLVVKGVEAGEGATVYSTTAEAFTIDEDPNAKVNGKTGEPSDMWTKGVQENATAIRVVTKADFPYGDTQTITVKTELKDAKSGDVVVNKAVGRADHTKMRMRTSAQFVVLTPVELTVKKVWKDAEDEVEDFTSEVAVDKVGENYSVIVTNTAELDPTPDPTPTPTPTPKPDKPLPLTGAQTSALMVVAAGAMALGVTFLRYARRR